MSISTLISRWIGKHAAPAPIVTTKTQETTMTEPTPAAPVAAAAVGTAPAAAPAAPDESLPAEILDKLKAILTTAGHDVGGVWDEAVALAKKLV